MIISVNKAPNYLFYADFNMISRIIKLINDAKTTLAFLTNAFSIRSSIKFNAFDDASISATSEVESI